MSFYKNFDPRIWIPLNIIGFLCVLLTAFSIVLLSYQIRNEPQGQDLTKPDKICSFCALISFGVAILSDNVYVSLVKYPSDDVSVSVFEANFYTICNTFWALGYAFTYSLFWNRMTQSFETSMFEISRGSTVLFYIAVSLYLMVQLVISVCWVPVTLDLWSWSEYTLYYYYPLLWVRFTLDFFIHFDIVFLFSSKLYKLILFTAAVKRSSCSSTNLGLGGLPRTSMSTANLEPRQSVGSKSSKIAPSTPTPSVTSRPSIISTPTGDMMVDDPDLVVADMTTGQNSDLFDLLIKKFFLSVITILSTQLFTLSEIVISQGMLHAEQTGNFDFYNGSYIPFHVFRSLDAVVSTMYIMLSFHFNDKYYRKMCGICQLKCVDWWTHVVRSRVRSNSSKSLKVQPNETGQTASVPKMNL